MYYKNISNDTSKIANSKERTHYIFLKLGIKNTFC